MNINKSPKRLNKLINIDPKIFKNGLMPIEYFINVPKTDMFLFRPKSKSIDFNHKIKLNGKRLYEINSLKYLGTRIDNKLN